jgi:hypothetical protein
LSVIVSGGRAYEEGGGGENRGNQETSHVLLLFVGRDARLVLRQWVNLK